MLSLFHPHTPSLYVQWVNPALHKHTRETNHPTIFEYYQTYHAWISDAKVCVSGKGNDVLFFTSPLYILFFSPLDP